MQRESIMWGPQVRFQTKKQTEEMQGDHGATSDASAGCFAALKRQQKAATPLSRQ